jgi:hypothetical protein
VGEGGGVAGGGGHDPQIKHPDPRFEFEQGWKGDEGEVGVIQK